jgi:DNA-binding transcriptional LysR family regulator
MVSINDVHIRRLDLTLLVVFELLLKNRNMRVVAAEMGLTQSAISHAVGRLRSVSDDALFVRKGAGVEPTARALLIAPSLAEALAEIRGAVQIGRSFDPKTSTRRFTVAAPDTVVTALAPAVLANLADVAPRCQIMFSTFSHDKAEKAIAAGEADIAVGVFPDPPKETIGKAIASETFRVVSRRDHPRIAGVLDLNTYCVLDHLLVSHDHDARGTVDRVLNELKRQRRIAAVMPNFLLALAVASQSDAVFTAPSSACRYAASLFPLAVHEPPIALPSVDLTMLRHRQALSDPAVTWLAEIVTEAFRSFA